MITFNSFCGSNYINYIIVYDCDDNYSNVLDTIYTEVNRMIEQGYKPLGGISVVIDKNNMFRVSQAMSK